MMYNLLQKIDEQISVIPALLGRLIDLMIIIPWQWQVQLNETPVYSSFFQEWLYGVVVLLIWSYQVKVSKNRSRHPSIWFANRL